MGACLQADTVWAQASRVVQVLGHPVQVPVQPVGRELMSSGGTGELEELEGEKGMTVDLASYIWSGIQYCVTLKVTPSSLRFIFSNYSIGRGPKSGFPSGTKCQAIATVASFRGRAR